MAEFPALPLFTDAMTADCHHLTDAEFGLYTRILILMWRSPECKIPNDEAWMGRKLGRQPEQFMPLIREFCETTGNHITQKRLIKEWNYVKTRASQRSGAAKSRWDKENAPCNRNAGSHPSRNAPTPTPIPIPHLEESKVIGRASDEAAPPPKEKNARGTRLSLEWDLPKEWGQWAEAQGMTREAIIRECDKFKDYWISKTGSNATKADWQATWRNWVRKHLEEYAK